MKGAKGHPHGKDQHLERGVRAKERAAAKVPVLVIKKTLPGTIESIAIELAIWQPRR